MYGLNAPTKRHRLAEWIQKQESYICRLQETHFRPKDIQTESERMEKHIPWKWKVNKSWSSNPHIRENRPIIKKITIDKEGLCIMIKGSIQEEDPMTVNTYAPNTGNT